MLNNKIINLFVSLLPNYYIINLKNNKFRHINSIEMINYGTNWGMIGFITIIYLLKI